MALKKGEGGALPGADDKRARAGLNARVEGAAADDLHGAVELFHQRGVPQGVLPDAWPGESLAQFGQICSNPVLLSLLTIFCA